MNFNEVAGVSMYKNRKVSHEQVMYDRPLPHQAYIGPELKVRHAVPVSCIALHLFDWRNNVYPFKNLPS